MCSKIFQTKPLGIVTPLVLSEIRIMKDTFDIKLVNVLVKVEIISSDDGVVYLDNEDVFA